jgi:hypothetical protein
MKLYQQHQNYTPKLSRTEISVQIDANKYTPVGRKYLNTEIKNKMAELEDQGADIGNIYINPNKEIIFRSFITKPIWYKGRSNNISIWTNESEVQWIGR